MATNKEKLNALVTAALECGETIKSYGNYDEDSEEGHDVELIQHGALWVVAERNDGDDDATPYTDEAEARMAFAEIKTEIEEEE